MDKCRVDHWNNERERVVAICDRSLLVCKYDFVMLNCERIHRIPLNFVDRISHGAFCFPKHSLISGLVSTETACSEQPITVLTASKLVHENRQILDYRLKQKNKQFENKQFDSTGGSSVMRPQWRIMDNLITKSYNAAARMGRNENSLSHLVLALSQSMQASGADPTTQSLSNYQCVKFIHEDLEMIYSPYFFHHITNCKLKSMRRAMPHHDVWEEIFESSCHPTVAPEHH
ncbi:Tumor protein p63-regulated gene 1 protein [Merluccius polli]|uniref:Tumor protein p63-regulated gene 1 protein n=1 Tax=Merluccius polli TaxID=89951 RepID=A0AA47NYU0_MERPO|nr:Tumor protein p63-regulated gene 1 protein [Merluccius polli]